MNSSAPPPTAEATYGYQPHYIDALVCRMRDNSAHTFHTHFFLHDANFNVTAAVDATSGSGNYRTVIERYAYTPYGEVTVLDSDFSNDADGVSDIDNELLYTGRRLDPETGLQLNRNRYYHQQLGRWVTRDPLQYVDGYNLYAAYFVPNFTDPNGTDVCECCNAAVEDGRNTGAIPSEVEGRGGKGCRVRVVCRRGCTNGFPAYTQPPSPTGVITICLDCRMSHENLAQTIAHEVQHARDFCRKPFIDPNSPDDCILYESRACSKSCAVIFPNGGTAYDRCMECCVWFSCRHHGDAIKQPNPPCDASNIPTRPCFKYDPKRRRFVRDYTDPRCRDNRDRILPKPEL